MDRSTAGPSVQVAFAVHKVCPALVSDKVICTSVEGTAVWRRTLRIAYIEIGDISIVDTVAAL